MEAAGSTETSKYLPDCVASNHTRQISIKCVCVCVYDRTVKQKLHEVAQTGACVLYAAYVRCEPCNLFVHLSVPKDAP